MSQKNKAQTNQEKSGSGGTIVMTIIVIFCLVLGMSSCDGSHSSYQLHNKDGSLNTKYVQDMWEWQQKQK